MRTTSKRTRTTRRAGALLAGVALLGAAACTSDPAATPSSAGTTVPESERTGPADLTAALLEIESQPKYASSDWGYIAMDLETGEVLASQNEDDLFDPGSTMKTFAVSAALDAYGAEHTFDTPVYKDGTVAGDTLTGNVVLVAGGDLSFGLRAEPDGTLQYETMPALDHSYATVGVPGAVEPSGDPLAVLDGFAQSVKDAGITRIDGDVVIDDRLFEPISWPDGLVSPIWVNENLIDIEVTPGAAAGDATTVDWRPKTATYTVTSNVTTVATGEDPQLTVTEAVPGQLVVEGQLPAGSDPMLTVHEVDDPSAFARTAFIEALERSGVTVTATPTGPNPVAELPASGSYADTDKLAEHRSASLGAYVELIMKTSYNRGADLMACMVAVHAGSTDCTDGIAAEIDNFTKLGVSDSAVFPFDGAGSNDQNRASPRALATMVKAIAGTPYAEPFRTALPILGVDGTLGNVQSDSSVAGKAQLKTGNRAVGTPKGKLILLGNSLAGYVDAASGRTLVVVVAMGNMPFDTMEQFASVTDDQAKMVAAMQQAL